MRFGQGGVETRTIACLLEEFNKQREAEPRRSFWISLLFLLLRRASICSGLSKRFGDLCPCTGHG